MGIFFEWIILLKFLFDLDMVEPIHVGGVNMKKLFMVLPLVFLLCFTFSYQQQVEEVAEEEAKAIVETYVKARNEVNLTLLDEIYAPDVVVHDCSYPEDIVSLEALKNQYTFSHTAFPDLKITLDEMMIAKGDRIVWLWTLSGTNTGLFHTPLGDLPPTGKEVRFSGVAIDRLVEGKIAEEWVFWNVLDILQQLGFTITPPTPPEPPEEKK